LEGGRKAGKKRAVISTAEIIARQWKKEDEMKTLNSYQAL
jgi:hypothetical protein